MSTAKKIEETENPCGSFGPTQFWAYVWFVSVLVVGCAMTFVFATIDREMYDTGADPLDYNAYQENRAALSSIPSERNDPRSHGDLRTAQ